MKRNNLYMIIGIIIFIAVYIASRPTPETLERTGMDSMGRGLLFLAALADVLLTPISWIGIILFVVGINGLKKITVPEKNYTMISDKEKKVLRYFGATFLLTLALYTLLKVLNTFVLILAPIFILCMFTYLFLTYKSTAIIKKYGQTKLYPITWLLLLFVPIAHIVTPIIIWRKNNAILKKE